jgi:hypothetical protein
METLHETSIKYPRTHHLPWSDTIGPDGDHVLENVMTLQGHEIVVTEKLDGENTTLYRTHMHARSLDGRHHVSRGWIKSWHAHIAQLIPSGWRVCGENMFALHSIRYTALPSYFIVFNVHNGTHFLAWDEVEGFCAQRGFIAAPVLYRGAWNEKTVRACHTGTSRFGGAQEGYVVRLARAFPEDDFSNCVGKYVRPHHVQTGKHWMLKPVEKNGLAAT